MWLGWQGENILHGVSVQLPGTRGGRTGWRNSGDLVSSNLWHSGTRKPHGEGHCGNLYQDFTSFPVNDRLAPSRCICIHQ